MEWSRVVERAGQHRWLVLAGVFALMAGRAARER
jgi:hypothetical protein